MGITLRQKPQKNCSNKKTKSIFFFTLNFWGTKKSCWNSKMLLHFLGENQTYCLFNAEHQIESLKRAMALCRFLSLMRNKVIFVNKNCNENFNGLFKNLSFRAGQQNFFGKWSCGFLTKRSTSLPFDFLLLLESGQAKSILKEAHNVGVPIISINNNDFNLSNVSYPILVNNIQGGSLFVNCFLLSNCLVEGFLFSFIQ